MFSSQWRSILWSGVFILILLSILTPFSIFTISFIMVPLLILYVTLNRKAFIIHVSIALGIILLITGSLGIPMILIGLFFLVPAVVMGHFYKKEVAAHIVIVAAAITFLAEMIFGFLIAAMLGFNIVEETSEMFRESYDTVPEVLRQDIPEGLIDQVIFTMTQMIPLGMIYFAVFYTIITHGVGRRLLKRMGYSLNGLPPVRTWMVPKKLVWYFAGALILSLVTSPEQGNVLVMILYNVLPILTFVFCVQAISFLLYLGHMKGWNKSLTIVGIVGGILFSLIFGLFLLIALLGVFEIMFDFRNKLEKRQ